MILQNLDLPRLYDPFLIADGRPSLILDESKILSSKFPSSRRIISDNFQYLSIAFVSLSILLFSHHMFVYIASFKIYPDNVATYTPTFPADEN